MWVAIIISYSMTHLCNLVTSTIIINSFFYLYTTASNYTEEQQHVAVSQQEDLETPATKRTKVTVDQDKPDLSPFEIDSILSASVPDLGL